MQDYCSNIPSGVFEKPELREGMEVKAIGSIGPITAGNWYPIMGFQYNAGQDTYIDTIDDFGEGIGVNVKFLDLLNPRTPSKQDNGGWISVEDAPEENSPLLAYSKNHGYVIAFFEKGYWYDQLNGWLFSPTHYMPLPQKPL